MKRDHVTIDMEDIPRKMDKKLKMIQMNEEINEPKDEIKTGSSLKHYYLGCSCQICYQRYKFSKQPHFCNAKDRCHVVRKERIEDLEAVDTSKNDTSTELLPRSTIETECELNIEKKRDLCQVCIPQAYTPNLSIICSSNRFTFCFISCRS